MKKIDYKKLYEDKLLEDHTSKYLHIPFDRKKVGLFFLSLFMIGMSVFFFICMINLGNTLGLWKELSKSSSENPIFVFNHLYIVPSLIFEYLLICLTIVCIVAMFKDGFNKLKKFGEDGLISELISGLTLSLIGGLISGLIIGLILGLIGGLISGLISGLIFGLKEEFE